MRVRPDVSVVVIAYNDAGRLPRAVRSVLAQSLRSVEVVIVDDASTDGTGEVADRFAAAHPGRVRAVHLPENSGGCGRPRNVGIEHARGARVMFLDSDDVLDRHACLTMVAAAEETGADLVSGLCVRSHLGPHARETLWYPRLYRRRAVHDSVLDHPDLLYDTLSTNKCYRRDFLVAGGLRFVEGLHYEDLLFSAEAYLAAGRIAVVPHRVYTWYVEPHADRPSISNRRRELGNLADRLEIHRRIDRVFRSHGATELKLAKDAKFVNHDLLLYLYDLRVRDAGYRRRFLELAAPYVAELHPGALEAANRLPAIAAYLVGRGDLESAIAAAEFARKKVPELRAELIEQEGRIYWGERHLQDGPGRDILDITALGIHARPLNELRPATIVTELRRAGSRARMSGWVANPLGRVPADARLRGELELRDRRHRARAVRFPARLDHRGDRIAWRAAFDSRHRLRPLGFVDPLWDARLIMRVNDDRLVLRIAVDRGAVDRHEGRAGEAGVAGTAEHPGISGVRLAVRPRLTRLAGTSLRSYVTEAGNLTFVLEGGGRLTRPTVAAIRGFRRSAAGRRAWRSALQVERSARALRKSLRRNLTARKTKTAVFNRVLSRLPVRRGTVVFESHLGKQYSDNPKYIYRELRRSGIPVRAYWSYEGSPKGFPSDATLVRRGSWPYYLALARAQFWVDNQGFPEGLRKRKATTYVQTWHGSAYKLMGFDKPSLKNASRAEQQKFRRMVERYDCFLVRSEHDERTLVPGMGVSAELLPVGYPRNDPLVTGDRDPELARELAELRRELGLDDGREVVLYAPTFRGGPNGRPIARAGLPFDAARFAAELGGAQIMLVRPHYLSRTVLPRRLRHAVRTVGHIADITPLLLLADALITDYSSVMFDYALLDRPMIFYTPGEAERDGPPNVTRGQSWAPRGRESEGGYFDLAEEAPGPVVADEDALFAALSGLDAVRSDYADRRRAFAARYGEHDRGTAARAVVDRFFRDSRNLREGTRRA
ncbi:CDP-glycerol glycerophosphotransferase family protein [Actinomadura sp. 9N407]|uniref:bifunctional glycosyltransferase/CDP-glycerol:glycerophosphate glycerophosphotransferase n=1 Tax=Actinomadura sp. 9N407 TaxID=3375154 RepID=UPI00378DA212